MCEPRSPDTALASKSIWKTVDHARLDRRTQALSARHVAGRRCYSTAPPEREHNSLHLLPLHVERSLSEDFAFIAAFQPQVEYVSAVAIEHDESMPSIKVRLAANEGVSAQVKECFDELFGTLRAQAKQGNITLREALWKYRQLTMQDISRGDSQKQLLRIIVSLNRNKILGRLGSSKFKRPKHLTKSREPLPMRLRGLFRNYSSASVGDVNNEDNERLDLQIRNFEASFEVLENSAIDDMLPNIEHTIKQAFDLTGDGVQLPARLRALSFPESFLDARDVREVGKVANYWRISRHLALCSQRFHSQFADAQWYPLQHYTPSSKSKIIRQKFVHAEIQLLVYYELENPRLMPRTIGVSKEACFLCDSFIRAHGRFAITGAHRQIFPQWTIPDLKEYNSQTIDFFRQVLLAVCADVNHEYSRQTRLSSRPFPLQSAINLDVVQLLTPSTSTVPRHGSGRSSDNTRSAASNETSAILKSHGTKHDLPPPGFISEVDGHTSFESRRSAVAGDRRSVDDSIRALAGLPINIEVNEAVADHTTWVQIFASSTGSSMCSLQALQYPRLARATVSLEPVRQDQCQRILHLAEVPFDKDLMIEKGLDDTEDELSFKLVGAQGPEIQVCCRWSAFPT